MPSWLPVLPGPSQCTAGLHLRALKSKCCLSALPTERKVHLTLGKAKGNGFVAQKGAGTRHCPLIPVGAGGSKLGQAVVLPFLCLGVLSTAAGMGLHQASRTSSSLQKKKLRGLQGSPPGSGRPQNTGNAPCSVGPLQRRGEGRCSLCLSLPVLGGRNHLLQQAENSTLVPGNGHRLTLREACGNCSSGSS